MMKERALRAIAECRHIAMMSEEPGRITRRFLTPPMHDVHEHLIGRMKGLGMSTSLDAAGNLRGEWQPERSGNKRLVLGSHIDTVPDAGAFDGVLGVMLALEWVELAAEMRLPISIEVIAFSEEEGVRFGVPFLGSRAVAGTFDFETLGLEDAEGVRVDEAIRSFGLDPAQISAAVLDKSATGFLEIHIEQGPVLEAEGLHVAAVSAIAGQTRLKLAFGGHANHAGTTPMNLRKDALAAAAELITAVEALGKKTDGLVATVGRIVVEPNAGNVVPGYAQVSLDVRHASDAVRTAAINSLLASAHSICSRRKISLERTDQLEQAAVPMDSTMTRLLSEAIEAAGFAAKAMPSGAGHDAMIMAARLPTAMLFLRSPGGMSHHAAETVLEEDVEASLHVGRAFLQRFAVGIK
jgi:allantoate deiminase